MKTSFLELLFNNVAGLKTWTSLKRDPDTGIFLWIFHISSKSLIYRTPPDDCSCWSLHSNQNFYLVITLCLFFPSLFSFIIDNCNYGSLLRKCLKMKIFSLFTIVFYFLHKCCSDNFASAIICWHTLKKIQISLSKILDNCRMLREISKAAAMQELPSDLSFLMFFFILNMTLTYLLK